MHDLAMNLSRLAYRLVRERTISSCPECGGDGVIDGKQCAYNTPQIVVDMEWSVCPYGLLSTDWWRAMTRLDRARRISPLSGWPDVYTPATVTTLLAIDEAETEYVAERQREAQRKAGR